MLKREVQLGKSDAFRGEHLQLNKNEIFFGSLYDYIKLYIVPRVVVIPDGNRATVEMRRIPSAVVDTLYFLRPPPMTTIVLLRGRKWAWL